MIDEKFCERLPFWEELSEQGKKKFQDKGFRYTFAKGEKLGGEDNCRGVVFVRKGCLRVHILSDEGRDITLYRLYDGDVCMLSAACALPEITFDVFIDAEEESDCYVIGGADFSDIAERDLKLKLFAYETVLSRFSEVIWVLQQIMFMGVDRRLAIFLWDESVRKGDDFLVITQEQIAKYISSAREVVSKMLKYFAGEGIVEIVRGGVRIKDRQKLRQLAFEVGGGK